MRVFLNPTALLCLGLSLACGGGSSSRQAAPTGQLTLRLGSDSLPGYGQAWVSLEKVEGSGDGSTWVNLGSVKTSFDLMALQNGHSVVILPAASAPAGTYAQFRLTWATVNYQSAINQPAYVVLNGGQGQVLTMPATTVVPGAVTLHDGGSATAQILLSGQQAVQSRADGSYAFQATGQAYDLTGSATISGHAADGATPLAGVEVFAETVDGSGLATIQRRALTDGNGSFALEGLPTGSLYFVTAQPAATLSSYAAAAASPVNAVAATTYTANLAFTSPQAPGSLTLTISPASQATQGTWGELRQSVATGGTGAQTLIVRSQPVATGLAQDQAGFLGVAPGVYGITAQRRTSGGTPVMKTGTQVLVNAGGTTSTSLAYP